MFRATFFCSAALLIGCSEYDLSSKSDPLDEPLVTSPTGTGTGTATGTGTGGTGTGETQTNGWPPDDFGDEDRASGVLGTWLSGEIAVMSWDGGPALGQLEAPLAGHYHVYDLSIAESGAGQWNESAFIRIPNSANPSGLPNLGNCDGDFVVEDPDNVNPVPTGSTLYLGTFQLDAGINEVELWHYCPVYRDGDCPTLHIPDDPGSTCDSSNVNSVHFTGTAVCLVPA